MTGEHPSAEQLAGWIDDGLPSAEMRAIEAHLAACEECRAIVCCVADTRAEIELDEAEQLRRNA